MCTMARLRLYALALPLLCASCRVFSLERSTVALREVVNYYELLQVRLTITRDVDELLTANVDFDAHGRSFRLRTKTNTRLFSPDFRLNVHEDAGTVARPASSSTKRIVTGYLEGEKGSFVHGSLSEADFEGVVFSDNGETYHIEKLSRYNATTEEKGKVAIYKRSDLIYGPWNSTYCSGASARIKLIQESGGLSRRNRLTNDRILRKKREADGNTCTIHVWADYEFFSKVGNEDEANTLNEMALHIGITDSIYRRTAFHVGDGQKSGFGVAIAQADIITSNSISSNPLYGSFTSEELLEAFAGFNGLDAACLGHLFTYRDFSGILGLAYVADPSGSLAGGICEKKTTTLIGERNLNVGFTTLLNFGRKLPQAVSTITTAHEIGHGFGSPHDPAGQCSPGGSQGNYIMYPSVTDGNKPNNNQFSSCSTDIMGRTITSKGSCFVEQWQQECGNGIVEGDEECDCGSIDEETCKSNDPCCLPGECLLRPEANCSSVRSPCCEDCSIFPTNGSICLQGDECLVPARCNGKNDTCPPAEHKTGPCNNGNNVCEDGVCTGSICSNYSAESCFCTGAEELCHVCCQFNGRCVSTHSPDRPAAVMPADIQPGFPCKNYTGYCDERGECVYVDTDQSLDDLLSIIPSFTSIVQWLKENWYYVLGGLVLTVIIVVLLQVTYRRKRKKKSTTPAGRGTSEGVPLLRDNNPTHSTDHVTRL